MVIEVELKTAISLVAKREKKNELILFWVNVMDVVLANGLQLQMSQ